MSQEELSPRMVMKGVQAHNSGGDGIRIGHGVGDVHMEAVSVGGNEGHGINVLGAPEPPIEDSDKGADEHWYKKPIGVLGLSVTATLLATTAIVAIKHYFPAIGF